MSGQKIEIPNMEETIARMIRERRSSVSVTDSQGVPVEVLFLSQNHGHCITAAAPLIAIQCDLEYYAISGDADIIYGRVGDCMRRPDDVVLRAGYIVPDRRMPMGNTIRISRGIDHQICLADSSGEAVIACYQRRPAA